MKLKEKFENVLINCIDNMYDRGHTARECEIIADNYAEEFGKWLRENDDGSLLMSHLLEIFYNEKKL